MLKGGGCSGDWQNTEESSDASCARLPPGVHPPPPDASPSSSPAHTCSLITRSWVLWSLPASSHTHHYPHDNDHHWCHTLSRSHHTIVTRVWQGPVPQVTQVCVTILEAELWELLGCAPGRTSGQWYPWCSSLVTKSDESPQGVWCQDPAWLSWVTQTQYTVQPSTVHSTQYRHPCLVWSCRAINDTGLRNIARSFDK